MSAYEDDADRLAEHIPEECDDPYCQLCMELEDGVKEAPVKRPRTKRRRK